MSLLGRASPFWCEDFSGKVIRILHNYFNLVWFKMVFGSLRCSDTAETEEYLVVMCSLMHLPRGLARDLGGHSHQKGEVRPQQRQGVGFGFRMESRSYQSTVSTPLPVRNDVITSQQFPETNHSISSNWWCQMVIWRKSFYNLWCRSFILFVVWTFLVLQ